MAVMAIRSIGGRGFENAHTLTPITTNNQGIQSSTGRVRSGRHSTMSLDIRTVVARNAHICQPYGLTSVANALRTATLAISAHGAPRRQIWTLVHTTSRPAPTIQPPCMLTHTTNSVGSA